MGEDSVLAPGRANRSIGAWTPSDWTGADLMVG